MSVRRARVTAAYATVKIMDAASGKPTIYGFYEGAVLPDSADPEYVAGLVRRGYAEWLDSEEAKAVDKQEAEAENAEADRPAAEKAAAKAAKA